MLPDTMIIVSSVRRVVVETTAFGDDHRGPELPPETMDGQPPRHRCPARRGRAVAEEGGTRLPPVRPGRHRRHVGRGIRRPARPDHLGGRGRSGQPPAGSAAQGAARARLHGDRPPGGGRARPPRDRAAARAGRRQRLRHLHRHRLPRPLRHGAAQRGPLLETVDGDPRVPGLRARGAADPARPRADRRHRAPRRPRPRGVRGRGGGRRHRAPHRGLAGRAPHWGDPHAPAQGSVRARRHGRPRCWSSASSPPTWRSSSWG